MKGCMEVGPREEWGVVFGLWYCFLQPYNIYALIETKWVFPTLFETWTKI